MADAKTISRSALAKLGLSNIRWPYATRYDIRSPYGDEAFDDTYSALTQSLDGAPPTDISVIFSYYMGPPEVAEKFLSQDLLPFGISDATVDTILFPPLAMALRSYQYTGAVHTKQWECFIRKVLRRGADLHAPIPRYSGAYMGGFRLPSGFGTPLDELFALTETPTEAKIAADGWLQIPSTEGHDVMAYFEKEMDLHFDDDQRTVPSEIGIRSDTGAYFNPRKLVYVLDDEKPSVYWDWWINPESSICLAESEFTQLLKLSHWRELCLCSWDGLWPFNYPAWSDCVEPPDWDTEYLPEWQQLHDTAQRRANRRL